MCKHRATYVFAKYDAILDKKMHINSLLEGGLINDSLNPSHQLLGGQSRSQSVGWLVFVVGTRRFKVTFSS